MPAFAAAENVAPCSFSYVLKQVRNDVDKVHGGFFGIADPRDCTAFRNGLAIRCLDVGEDSRGMANERHRFFRRSMSSMRDSALRSLVRSRSGPWPAGMRRR